MIAIVNVSRNWAIGKNGDLLARIPEDMRYFRKMTEGKVCIMGNNTLKSFPGMSPLRNRVNIVLTHDENKKTSPGFQGTDEDNIAGRNTELIYVCSIEDAIAEAGRHPKDDIYVIGGAQVYSSMLPYCDTCLVTHNDRSDEDADAYFPDLNASGEWGLTEKSGEREWEGVHFRFCRYERIR